MNKTLHIGDRDIEFAADGALPIVYRQLFKGRSYINDVANCENDLDILLYIAFAMAYNADKKLTGTDIELWLRHNIDSPVSFVSDNAGALYELIMGNEATTETLKNAQAGQTAKKKKK